MDVQKTLKERQSEDFKLLVLCHSKGNPAMYELLRDRSLDDKPLMCPICGQHEVKNADCV